MEVDIKFEKQLNERQELRKRSIELTGELKESWERYYSSLEDGITDMIEYFEGVLPPFFPDTELYFDLIGMDNQARRFDTFRLALKRLENQK